MSMEDDNSYVYEGSDGDEEEYAYSDGDDDAGITPVVMPQVRFRVRWCGEGGVCC